MGWEKILVNGAANKGLMSKRYKHLVQLNIRKAPQSKSGQKIQIDISPKKHTDGQQSHEKTLSITSLLETCKSEPQ